MSQGLPEENGPDSSAVLQTDGVLFQWQAKSLGSQTRLTNSTLVRGERVKELCLQVLVVLSNNAPLFRDRLLCCELISISLYLLENGFIFFLPEGETK